MESLLIMDTQLLLLLLLMLSLLMLTLVMLVMSATLLMLLILVMLVMPAMLSARGKLMLMLTPNWWVLTPDHLMSPLTAMQ